MTSNDHNGHSADQALRIVGWRVLLVITAVALALGVGVVCVFMWFALALSSNFMHAPRWPVTIITMVVFLASVPLQSAALRLVAKHAGCNASYVAGGASAGALFGAVAATWIALESWGDSDDGHAAIALGGLFLFITSLLSCCLSLLGAVVGTMCRPTDVAAAVGRATP